MHSNTLRKRPDQIRYYFLLVTNEGTIHTGATHGGIKYVQKAGHSVSKIFLSDLVTRKVIEVRMSVERFLRLWADNYLDTEWDFEAAQDAMRKAAAAARAARSSA